MKNATALSGMMLSELSKAIQDVLAKHGNMPMIVQVAGNESYNAVNFPVDYVRVELGSLPNNGIRQIVAKFVITCGD